MLRFAGVRLLKLSLSLDERESLSCLLLTILFSLYDSCISGEQEVLLEHRSKLSSIVVLQRLRRRQFDRPRLSALAAAVHHRDHVEVSEGGGVEERSAHIPTLLVLGEVVHVADAIDIEIARACTNSHSK